MKKFMNSTKDDKKYLRKAMVFMRNFTLPLKVERFLSVIGDKDKMHFKYLEGQMALLKEDELFELGRMLDFYVSMGYSVEEVACVYLDYIKASLEESIYFRQHGAYRHSSLKDVESDVYLNKDYMNTYVIGMAFALYLFKMHRSCMDIYKDFIAGRKGKYLEIGPGHGEQLYGALRYADMDDYTVVDISPTSIELTQKYIDFRMSDIGKRNADIHYFCEDFLKFAVSGQTYDTIVMSAVLEHLEDPLVFFRKIHGLCHDKTSVYMTASIDTPARDHLYLFSGPEEVLSMARETGFNVGKYELITYNANSAEEARKRREPVKVAMVLSKK